MSQPVTVTDLAFRRPGFQLGPVSFHVPAGGRFAIVGPPERCIDRLRALKALGLDKVAISGGMRGASAKDAAVSKELVARDVLPAMH